MSRYWAGSVMPGCGRQSRDVGAQGKIESNDATGSCAFSTSVASGVERHFTMKSQMFRASNVAPYPPPSSCVPTSGIGASSIGFCLPSMSAGSKPSPTSGSSDGSLPSMKKLTARAGWPLSILFFSRP
jgi:hypothetical protein